jgi:hypothetical protein
MLAFTHHWPYFRLIFRQVPYLTQEQNREENEKVSLETTFRQLLLEDENKDPSPLPLALSYSENSLALPVILGLQGH